MTKNVKLYASTPSRHARARADRPVRALCGCTLLLQHPVRDVKGVTALVREDELQDGRLELEDPPQLALVVRRELRLDALDELRDGVAAPRPRLPSR